MNIPIPLKFSSLPYVVTGSQPIAYVRSILVVVFAGFLWGGCASDQPIARYNASENNTIYETRLITVVNQLSERGYGNSSSITMQGGARCQGQNCTPDIVKLTFSVSGSAEVVFPDRSIEIVADGETYTWEDQMQLRDEDLQRMAVVGQIGGVRLRLSALETIVNADSVTGSIGGRSFEMDERDKAELGRFLTAMRNPSAPPDADS